MDFSLQRFRNPKNLLGLFLTSNLEVAKRTNYSEDRGLKVRFSLAMIVFETCEKNWLRLSLLVCRFLEVHSAMHVDMIMIMSCVDLGVVFYTQQTSTTDAIGLAVMPGLHMLWGKRKVLHAQKLLLTYSPCAPAEARQSLFFWEGNFVGNLAGILWDFFSDPQNKGSKLSGKISEHFSRKIRSPPKNLSCQSSLCRRATLITSDPRNRNHKSSEVPEGHHPTIRGAQPSARLLVGLRITNAKRRVFWTQRT